MDEECPRLGIPRDMDFAATTFHVKHSPPPSPPIVQKMQKWLKSKNYLDII